MTRYYKTRKDSETGKKITSILDREKEFDKKAAELGDKYGFEYAVHSSFYHRAIEGVRLNEQPDMDIWKRERGSSYGIYSLRAGCKNKAKRELFNKITNDFDEVNKLSIKRREFDKVVGNKSINYAGLNFSKEYYLFYGVDIGGDLPKDCEEISNLEYLELTEE